MISLPAKASIVRPNAPVSILDGSRSSGVPRTKYRRCRVAPEHRSRRRRTASRSERSASRSAIVEPSRGAWAHSGPSGFQHVAASSTSVRARANSAGVNMPAWRTTTRIRPLGWCRYMRDRSNSWSVVGGSGCSRRPIVTGPCILRSEVARSGLPGCDVAGARTRDRGYDFGAPDPCRYGRSSSSTSEVSPWCTCMGGCRRPARRVPLPSERAFPECPKRTHVPATGRDQACWTEPTAAASRPPPVARAVCRTGPGRRTRQARIPTPVPDPAARLLVQHGLRCGRHDHARAEKAHPRTSPRARGRCSRGTGIEYTNRHALMPAPPRYSRSKRCDENVKIRGSRCRQEVLLTKPIGLPSGSVNIPIST